MSRKSAEKKHDQTADQHQRNLISMIKRFSNSHHTHTVFADFVEMAAISISNAVDRTQFDPREKRYLEIVGKYSKQEVALFPQMFAELAESFELRVAMMQKAASAGAATSSLTDVLGETYMMLELGNARAGQFFTPYHVSRMMAMMSVGDGGSVVRDHGFIRLQEPACGAGGMVIAVADSLNDAGHNYQQTMHATCIDIDPCCVHMAYIQLSLLHIPAVVVHGNALSLDVWGMWYTPAHVIDGWKWKLRRREAESQARALLDAPVTEPTLSDAQRGPDANVDYGGGDTVLEDLVVVDDMVRIETIADDEAPTVKLFTKIDQLALF
ncbi:N-6 DNA Methylase [Burkholderia sp. D7]|nr:N-6 DNA Methylase [Burkholderia sp. D7]